MLDFDRMRTLSDCIAYHAQQRPHATALEFDGRVTSYGDLHRKTVLFAAALRCENESYGERIGYLGKNSDRYFELLFAAAQARKVVVPLNWRLTSNEWAYILRDSGVTRLFVDAEFERQGLDLGAELALQHVESIDDACSWSRLQHLAKHAETSARAAEDDVIVQIYTSGTTGKPKGAMLTHRNLLALREPGLRAGLSWFPREEDTSLAVMPVAHVAGTAYGIFGLHSGGRIVIMREFDAAAVWAMLASSGASHMLLAPTAIQLLLDHPVERTAQPRDLRCLTYGGSPISPSLLERCIDRLKCGLVQMYGMTEAAGGISALTPEDHHAGDPLRLTSAGRPMPGVELAVVDRNGSHLPAGQTGEIVIRSAAVMAGYWGRPEATSEAIDASGWLRTGDIGYIDSDGYLFVLDRAKDTIISGAENIYPLEIENTLLRHPDIADAAVIGVPSERWGEEVKAVVVAKPGSSIDAAALMVWARQHIAAYKVPKSVDVVDVLPRNPNGKLLRRVLREPYWAAYGKKIA